MSNHNPNKYTTWVLFTCLGYLLGGSEYYAIVGLTLATLLSTIKTGFEKESGDAAPTQTH